MTIPSENHPWKQYTRLSRDNPASLNADIGEFMDMLKESGFSVSRSYIYRYIKLGKIPYFYKVKIGGHTGDKYFIRLEDAKKFIKSFDYFGRNK